MKDASYRIMVLDAAVYAVQQAVDQHDWFRKRGRVKYTKLRDDPVVIRSFHISSIKYLDMAGFMCRYAGCAVVQDKPRSVNIIGREHIFEFLEPYYKLFWQEIESGDYEYCGALEQTTRFRLTNPGEDEYFDNRVQPLAVAHTVANRWPELRIRPGDPDWPADGAEINLRRDTDGAKLRGMDLSSVRIT